MASELQVDTIAPETGTEVTITELASSSVNITGGSVTGITDLTVADGGTGVSTLADGGILIGNVAAAVDVLAPGATTTFLVGGGAATAPVWTTATGTGAPVRETSPTLVTPLLGTPTSGTLTNCTGYPGTSLTVIDAAGDGLIGTAADTAARAALIYGKMIYGLTYDNGTDATNDININTGGCIDSTNVRWMRLATALGKQSEVAWAVGGTTGTPVGMLDTGTVGNSDYYIWLIGRSDTGVIDSLCSLSSTAPSMPTSYDYKRLIGWFKRVGGTIVAFDTYETEGGGLELIWDAPTVDISLTSTLTTSRRTDAVKVPLDFSTTAHLQVFMNDAASSFVAWL